MPLAVVQVGRLAFVLFAVLRPWLHSSYFVALASLHSIGRAYLIIGSAVLPFGSWLLKLELLASAIHVLEQQVYCSFARKHCLP